MNKIARIAKLEISVLFYSPVAWLVLVIFMIQTGIGFFGMMAGYKEMFLMGEKINNLTFSLFAGMNGLFDKVLQTLYLYIPLLTMGLMSREASSGTIKLLLSSPVKLRQIVLGKYAAMVIYGLLMMLILMVYSVFGAMVIKEADTTLIASGLLGLFLLLCTYAAIGLFMSCLTQYQVVAAISTLAVFAMLNYVGNIGQQIDVVRDLTYFLSISGRTEDMLKGLISSKDIFYYLLIIALFLGLAILLLKSRQESKPKGIVWGRYLALLSLVLLAGYITSRPALTGYRDMTRSKMRTLTEQSQQVAAAIKGPLIITTYVNLLDQHVYSGLPVARNVDLARFEEYRRFIPELDMEYVYYYDSVNIAGNRNLIYQGDISGLSLGQLAEKVADNFELDLNRFLTPQQIRQKTDLRPEGNAFVRTLGYRGKTSMLRLFNDIRQFPEEAEITTAIKRLVDTVQVVAFSSGNNERSTSIKSERSYQLLAADKKYRQGLLNQGFDVVTLDLNEEELSPEISLLVLADPGKPLGDTALARIKTYLARGGNMLITAEPGSGKFLDPVMEIFNARFKAGTLISGKKGNAPASVTVTGSGGSMTMNTVSAIETAGIKDYQLDTLLGTAPGTWNMKQGFDLTATELNYDSSRRDEKGKFAVAISLQKRTGNKQQQIIICGDADFMSNNGVEQGSNLRFTNGIFNWFTGGRFPVSLSRPRPTDDELLLSKKQMSVYRWAILWVGAGLIIAAGCILLISRKRK